MLKLSYLQRLSRILAINQLNSLYNSLPNVVNAPALPSNLLRPQRRIHLGSQLQKYNKKASKEDDSDDENAEEFKDERDSKVVKTKVNSLRADLLIKAGLGMARNKIENIFYDSKIRVNGKKLAKKSAQLNVGDEIDVIRGFSTANPAHIIVARVIILSAKDGEESTTVNLRRFKSLLIENYQGINAYKSSETVDH